MPERVARRRLPLPSRAGAPQKARTARDVTKRPHASRA
jgi:hypothetical protein